MLSGICAGADWKRFNETQAAARSNLVTLYANKKRLYDRAEFIKAALKDAVIPLFALQVRERVVLHALAKPTRSFVRAKYWQ